jgi:hypothetical protein
MTMTSDNPQASLFDDPTGEELARRREAYEDRVEARRERLQNAASRARDDSASRLARANAIANGIPMGQPVLVGHHSEKRHRRDLDQIHTNMSKGVELAKQADDLSARAASVGSGGISSDDPDAIEKLEAKRDRLITSRDRMKKANKLFPKPGWSDALTEAEKKCAESNFRFWPGGTDKPFPSVSSETANIRRVEERIAQLRAKSLRPIFDTITGNGWTISEDREDNRLVFAFDVKPEASTLAALRSSGFKWSPTRGAHVRMMSYGAIYAAKEIAKQLDPDVFTESV